MTLPEGYAGVAAPGAWGFAVDAAASWLRDVLAGGATVHGWAGAQEGASSLSGRGRAFSVPAPARGPEGRERWVVRHYYRGGTVAGPLLGDRYLALGRRRPLAEADAAVAARARGIPTPAVVAGAVYPAGVFYRADLVTEEIPDAADLAEVLFGANPHGVEAEAALTAAGALVRGLERAGVFHPDLNAKNVMLRRQQGAPAALLVDLDRCCARAAGVPAPAIPMRRRLERSLRKHEARAGRYLPAGAWAALHRGFEAS